ncbi:MAG: cytochrome c family protein [Alphaproteobacteria bacterium]
MKNQKDPLFGNKVAGAVLISLLVVMLIGYGADAIYTIDRTADAYPIEVAENDAGVETAEAVVEVIPPIADLLVLASIDDGAKVVKKCAACHEFTKDGNNKVGPVLWNIVGSNIAAVDGFQYSSALTALDGVWDYEALNLFLLNPKQYASGTKMSFAGLRKPKDRAAIIAYMRAQSDNPVPLP